VSKVLDAREAREPAPGGGDLYLSVAPGVRLSAAARGAVLEPTRPRGDHLGDPERPALQGAFAIAGPGVRAGVDLGAIRQVDIAPTLAALLGIGPPRDAVGRVLEGALALSAPAPSPAPDVRSRP
jgi:hypothetical protein